MPESIRRVPPGDNRERSICADCGHIINENPKVVVGSVTWALEAWRLAGGGPVGAPAGNPMTDPRGARSLAVGHEGGAP